MPDYFTLDELNALPDMPDFDDSQYEAAGGWIEDLIERVVGTSFVARTFTDEPHDGGSDVIVLDKPWVLSVTSATVNGVLVTDSIVQSNGVIRRIGANGRSTCWDSTSSYPTYGNVLVTYEAGYSTTPPADLKQAALYAARAWLLANSEFAGMDARRTSMSMGDGGTINFVIAGENRPTGYPESDAVILGYKNRLDGPSVG